MRGLYIHIPFCVSKCNYCDFASYSGKQELIGRYMESLVSEAKLYRGMKFDTIYIGGGTPTSVPASELKRMICCVRDIFDTESCIEFTVEANPATVTKEYASVLLECGANRISLGAQSFDDEELKLLGRAHTAHETETTVNILRDAGFCNISLDIMYGLPGQTLDVLSKSILRVLNLNPEHISCYGLKIEDGTPMHNMLMSGKIIETDQDEFADMYEYICRELGGCGYGRYEISNFSKSGKESKHNLKYWQCGEYLGLGLGASSYIDGVRFSKSPLFQDYFDGFKLSERIELTREDMMSEFIVLGLRMTDCGVDTEEFSRRFGCDVFSVYGDTIEKYVSNGLLDISGKRLALTDRACFISNYVMRGFV